MITNEQLEIAANFAVALIERGVSFEQLKNATAQEELLNVLVSVLGGVRAAAGTEPAWPIEKLMADRRITFGLHRHGVEHVCELTSLSLDDIESMRNFGSLTAVAIQEALQRFGLALRPAHISRRFALEQLFGTLQAAPLRLIFAGHYHGFTTAGIHSLDDLLSYSADDLAKVRFQSSTGALKWPVFRPDALRDIESTLQEIGLHLREE